MPKKQLLEALYSLRKALKCDPEEVPCTIRCSNAKEQGGTIYPRATAVKEAQLLIRWILRGGKSRVKNLVDDKIAPREQLREILEFIDNEVDLLDYLPAGPAMLRKLSDFIKDLEPPKPKAKRGIKPRKPRPLTPRQIEVMQVVFDCNGNTAEAARKLGRHRKTIDEIFKAAQSKAGIKIMQHKTVALPRDRREQAAITYDDDRRSR